MPYFLQQPYTNLYIIQECNNKYCLYFRIQLMNYNILKKYINTIYSILMIFIDILILRTGVQIINKTFKNKSDGMTI
jgi:hypothetical protein